MGRRRKNPLMFIGLNRNGDAVGDSGGFDVVLVVVGE